MIVTQILSAANPVALVQLAGRRLLDNPSFVESLVSRPMLPPWILVRGLCLTMGIRLVCLKSLGKFGPDRFWGQGLGYEVALDDV